MAGNWSYYSHYDKKSSTPIGCNDYFRIYTARCPNVCRDVKDMNREESLPRSVLAKLERRTTACAPPSLGSFFVYLLLNWIFTCMLVPKCNVVVEKRRFGFVFRPLQIYERCTFYFGRMLCHFLAEKSQQQMKLYQMTYFPCQDNLTSISTVGKTLPPCPCCFLIKNKIHVLFVILWVFFISSPLLLLPCSPALCWGALLGGVFAPHCS